MILVVDMEIHASNRNKSVVQEKMKGPYYAYILDRILRQVIKCKALIKQTVEDQGYHDDRKQPVLQIIMFHVHSTTYLRHCR